MTQHIEEARKMEPIAAYTIDHTGCWHMSGDVQNLEEIASKGSLGPTEVVYLVRLSDAQAALAAAEERGRIEERERIRLDLIVGLRNWIHARYGKWITFRSARIFADAITKEPTP